MVRRALTQLRDVLTDPEVAGCDPDSVEFAIAHRKVVQRKPHGAGICSQASMPSAEPWTSVTSGTPQAPDSRSAVGRASWPTFIPTPLRPTLFLWLPLQHTIELRRRGSSEAA